MIVLRKASEINVGCEIIIETLSGELQKKIVMNRYVVKSNRHIRFSFLGPSSSLTRVDFILNKDDLVKVYIGSI